jgi:hypothetical protein
MVTWTQIRCLDCDGRGQCAGYTADGGDFLGAIECRTCAGSGRVFRSASGVLAQWPGGPFLGREPAKVPVNSPASPRGIRLPTR